ncbi:MAG: DNA repair protein RecO [Lachnospiraceae bacterium]
MNEHHIVVTGMVIHVMPISEFDKRILILTTDRGKITVFARGARRPNSQYLAACNLFAFGEFELYEGKNAYNLSKVQISNYFRELILDYENACYGFYFLELSEYYARENADDKNLLKLLYQSLRALENKGLENALIQRIFELKLLVIEGEYPNLFSCQKCGSTQDLHSFAVRAGGLICDTCRVDEKRILMSDALIYTMQYIITSSIEKLYTFSLSAEVFTELDQVMEELIKIYIPHKFKSFEILKTILS